MRHRKSKKNKGTAFLTTFMVMALLAVGATVYVDAATQTMREARRSTVDVQTMNLCESGVQTILRTMWRPFKIAQHFDDLDDDYEGATNTDPTGIESGELPNVGRFAAGVIEYTQIDSYTRLVVIRSVGYIDYDGDDTLDIIEPNKTVDASSLFQLSRSKVFDYTYFINNYGWMYGFNSGSMIVNGDMRANGNFDFNGGTPAINGTVVASQNNKLDPAATGQINLAPVKWTDSTYTSNYNGTTGMTSRWRQPYDPAIHGAIGSTEFEKWRDLVYYSTATVSNNRLFGAVLEDRDGSKGWTKTTDAATPTYNLLDTNPATEVPMPDLSNISKYHTLSQNYTNTKATYGDGTANPNYGQGAYVEVWNSSTSSYQRVSTNGVITGSAVLVGTDANPIRIHGPVTITQDLVIKGTVQGQGTFYTGRNVHIVGSVRYKNPPSWKGTNPQTIDNENEKKDMLAMAARGSVIMGNPTQFGTNPLYYMTPPFTKGRYDDNGNYIAPYNANETDSTGRKRYQSTITDSQMNAIAEGVNQIDGIVYTNNVAGGALGTAGGGLTVNGSIISKDEAMVLYSLPLRMNYDNRIKERKATSKPLIDIELPRSPTLLRSTWQDWGLVFSRSSTASPSSTTPDVDSNGKKNRGKGWGVTSILGLGNN